MQHPKKVTVRAFIHHETKVQYSFIEASPGCKSLALGKALDVKCDNMEEAKTQVLTQLWNKSPIEKAIFFTENPLVIVGNTEIWIDLNMLGQDVKDCIDNKTRQEFTKTDHDILKRHRSVRTMEKVDVGLAGGAGLLAGLAWIAYSQGADPWSWVTDNGSLAQQSESSNLQKARAKILADRKARQRQEAINEEMSRKQGMLATRDFLGRPGIAVAKKPWMPGAERTSAAPEKRGFSLAYENKPQAISFR